MKRTPVAPLTTADLRQRKARAARDHHRVLAKKDALALEYGVAELLALLEEAQTCHYCRMPLGWTAELDHVEPVSRSARNHRLDNLVVCCRICNILKGALSGAEFLAFLEYLKEIDPRGQWDLKRRLTAGGKAVYAKRRKMS